MTIPTPTSEGLAGLSGAVPAGVPDELTLARLAGEFFAALPTFSPPASLPPLLSTAAPSIPFYFLGEAGAFQSAPQALGAAPTAENRVVPQSFGLPGEAELHQILAELGT